MFIIFGSPRSGTTICAQTLSAHPDITVPNETDFIVPMVFIYTRIPSPDLGKAMIADLIVNSHAFQNSIGKYLQPIQVRELVTECNYHPTQILTALYDQIAAASGAQLAGDKSPNDLDFIKILVESESIAGIKVVHLVRDVRDMMVSLRQTGWLPDADEYFPRLWASNNLYLYTKYKHQPDDYLLIRYEDMVRKPAEVFKGICTFLGVLYRAEILDPAMRPARHQDRTNLQKPFYTSRTNVYKSSLEKHDIANYERQAGEALETFGYPLELGSRSFKNVFTRLMRYR